MATFVAVLLSPRAQGQGHAGPKFQRIRQKVRKSELKQTVTED